MSPLPFQDRVILITGATGALGRAYATCFRGGKVCINDLNVKRDGTMQTGKIDKAQTM
jgi:NAD(P)-dependent dehydrogenase (short-subunit alcohol dehydrogenase family)